MLLTIGDWLSTIALIAATVCAFAIGCGDKKEKSLVKKRQSLDMGVSDLDEVQPVKREVSRAQEIKDGARGKKAEYKTLAQMEKSDFDKSMHVDGPKSAGAAAAP
ncbi:hypothetical protein PRIPAC_93132 [Pristionchus pacificus]|uniref:Uncharacterized protein n=1 Tax=Pristionchus pacificus TaxID=54126 RepID=A0A2A6BB27_PRIPA|nr:hypothetical protein PRIPAC_93132 [Pristionchus pacificus]|eukprot:PDM63083.1 hypothetical protein PRIPAC_50298 [Pristionchus pacificus]